jgi:hypothetical protein
MKKHLFLLMAIVCITAVNAQDAGKVWGSLTMSWFGVDFTKAKMIGLDDSPHKIRDEYFKAWNDVTIDMDLAKMFQKNSVAKDPNSITKLNLARETETLTSTDETELSKETIEGMVKQIIPTGGSKKEGLGLVFIVQSFNKGTGMATVDVTFFDIATRKVIWLKKMTGKASGGPAKTAWAAAIKDIFSQIDKKEFKAWKKEANY